MNPRAGNLTARNIEHAQSTGTGLRASSCDGSRKYARSESKEFQKHDSPSGLVKYPHVGVAVVTDWRTKARILRARAPAAPRATTARFSLRCGSVVVVATALTPWRLLESVAILHAVFVSSPISYATQQSNTNTSFFYFSSFFRYFLILPFVRFTFSSLCTPTCYTRLIKSIRETVTIYRFPVTYTYTKVYGG